MHIAKSLITIGFVSLSAVFLLGAGFQKPKVPSVDVELLTVIPSADVRGMVDDRASYDEIDAPDDGTPYGISSALVLSGEWRQADSILATAIVDDPDNRQLHLLLAEIHFYYYKDLGLSNALDKVARHATRAFELGLAAGETNLRAADLVAEAAVAVSDPATLDALFTRAAASDTTGLVELAYARTLDNLRSPLAEDAFRRAAALSSEGNTGALEAYAEWLLDRGRTTDVVELLAPSATTAGNPYLGFLRGVALERNGRAQEAVESYETYRKFSDVYPAPSRFRIPGSAAQENAGVRFKDEESGGPGRVPRSLQHATSALNDSKAQKGLSYLLYGEARGESAGGKRAEGWVARNRVLRGNVYNSDDKSCPYVKNGGSTLAEKYKNVMCQSGPQFEGMCPQWCSNPDTKACQDNGDTAAAAADVYNGTAPDPVGEHCPGGFETYGGWCDSKTRCKGGTNTFRLKGALFNYAQLCPNLCTISVGHVCSNGTPDNCFYINTKYARKGNVTYSGSLSSNQCGVTSEFTAKAGTHRGHLEGPEAKANPNFDLYLQKKSGSKWSDVARSEQTGAVEDVSYESSSSSTKFRWKVCAAKKSSGDLRLFTARP